MVTLMKPVKGKGVELQQLVGRRSGKGRVEQVIKQAIDLVRDDGVVVGKIAHQPNAVILFQAWVPDEDCSRIHKEVTKLRLAGGKNIPRQEGVCWKKPVASAAVRGFHDEEEDARLTQEALERYGFTEAEIHNEADEPEEATDADTSET